MGLQFSFLLAGTIIIENVFYLPGLGRLVFQAIAQRDLVVVKDLVMLLAAAVVVVNLIVDLLYAVLDPRLRAGRSEEHTSELQSLMRISYAVFCLKKKNSKQP